MTVRRVVTGHDAEGRSLILVDEKVAPIETPSSSVAQIWVTDGIPVSNIGFEDMSGRPLSLQPPPGGSQLWIVTIPPKEEGGVASNVDDLNRHTTATIDYLIILQGELRLFLDEGETILKQFDVLVQRGTAHAWENAGREPVVLAVMLVDAVPL
jgi:Cupin domain.